MAAVGVRVAGKKTTFRVEGGGENLKWEEKTWEFTAVADKTSLEIHTIETSGPLSGPLVDKVAVVEVKN